MNEHTRMTATADAMNETVSVKTDSERIHRWKRLALRRMGAALADTRRSERAGRWMRRLLRVAPGLMAARRFNPWSRGRELPPAPQQSFREWYRRERGLSDGGRQAGGRGR